MGNLRLCDRRELVVDVDEHTGDIVYLKDLAQDLVVIDRPPLWEFQVNHIDRELAEWRHHRRVLAGCVRRVATVRKDEPEVIRLWRT